jgi:hypothetical protein
MLIREFLIEQAGADGGDMKQLIAVITKKLKELPYDEETVHALQEIEDMLNHVNAGGKLGMINNKLTEIHDDKVNEARKLLAKYILSIRMSPEQREDLFARWKADKLVNRKVLLSPGKHTFAQIISGYDQNPGIKELTDDLVEIAALGQGKGEFLLSVFSRGISKMQKGDLNVDGKSIEIKTNQGGGGRFMDQEVKPTTKWAQAVNDFMKYVVQPSGMANKFPQSGINVTKLADLYNILPSLGKKELRPKFKKYFTQVVQAVFPIPEIDTEAIVNAILSGDVKTAKQAYAVASLEFYLNVKKDDGVLYIDLTKSPYTTVFFRDNAELNAGGMRLHADTFYPITSDARYAYPQFSVVDSKRLQSNDAETGLDISQVQPKQKKKVSTQQPKEPINKSAPTPAPKTPLGAPNKVPMGQPKTTNPIKPVSTVAR